MPLTSLRRVRVGRILRPGGRKGEAYRAEEGEGWKYTEGRKKKNTEQGIKEKVGGILSRGSRREREEY